MTIEELVKLIMDNGVTIVVIAYFMYTGNTVLKNLEKTMGKMNDTLVKICTKIDVDIDDEKKESEEK